MRDIKNNIFYDEFKYNIKPSWNKHIWIIDISTFISPTNKAESIFELRYTRIMLSNLILFKIESKYGTTIHIFEQLFIYTPSV